MVTHIAILTIISAIPHVGDVDVRTVSPAPAGESVLVVDIGEPSVIVWTPVYVLAVATLDVVCASDGDVAWLDEDVVEVTNNSGSVPVVRVQAEHAFDGRGYGLVSAPGYAEYLAEQFATQVNRALESTLTEQDG